MAFLCTCCNEMHDERPAIAARQPDAYRHLSEEEKIAYHAECDSDFCVIRYPQQTDYFIRTCLEIPIEGETETLEYGVWVSLSEKSFADYQTHYPKSWQDFEEKVYFGWLNTHIPDYEWDNIPMKVVTRNGIRPIVYPDPAFAHALVGDVYHGISAAEADARIHRLLDK